MRQLQNIAAFFFITAVAVLSVIAILGIWKVFSSDVITKSFQTLGLLSVVSIVVIVASHYIEMRGQDGSSGETPYTPHPAFRVIRRGTLAALIILAALLALLGVMAIWDVIADKEVVWRSLGSLMVAAFGSLIIGITCIEREKLGQQKPGVASGGVGHVALFIVGVLILLWLLSVFARMF